MHIKISVNSKSFMTGVSAKYHDFGQCHVLCTFRAKYAFSFKFEITDMFRISIVMLRVIHN